MAPVEPALEIGILGLQLDTQSGSTTSRSVSDATGYKLRFDRTKTHCTLNGQYAPWSKVEIPLVQSQAGGDLTPCLSDPIHCLGGPFEQILEICRRGSEARLGNTNPVRRGRMGQLECFVMKKDLPWESWRQRWWDHVEVGKGKSVLLL